MNIKDIITEARSLLDDKLSTGTSQRDLLYDDAELILWANEAVNEAAIRTQGLRIKREYTFPAGVSRVPLGADVLSVGENAVFKSLPMPTRKNILTEDDTTERWGVVSATPTTIAHMRTPPELWLDTSPLLDFLVDVEVAVYLTVALKSADAIPLPQYQHSSLVNWVLSRAYLKHDTETESLERSRHARNLFDRAFGQQQNFSQVETMRDTRKQRTKPSYF